MLTIRARLSLSYAALVAACGAVLITLVYLYMRYVPTYDLQVRIDPAVELDPDTTPLPTGDGDIQPAHPLEIRSVDDVLDNLLIASLAALGVLIILGGILGWIMAGRIVKPLAAINTAANRAATGELDHRLTMDGPRDEIRDLSETFDRMLASLQHSFDAQQRFAANASHELRSPLTTIKTMIDVTFADPDADASELRALTERIRDVNQNNIDTVDALLDLAHVTSVHPAPERVDVATLINETTAELAAEMTANQVTLEIGSIDAWALGNPTLLRQAFSNLLRNATRHNHPGGRITVHTASTAQTLRLTVVNTGPVLTEEAIDQLTEPFARANGRALTRGAGHGLGLAIVAAIATAHDGRLTLELKPGGGLVAHLNLPISP
ncbi:HAMP domain-containing histidine kinase [Microbacterium sp. HD4P20]|uniref:sensor histidine kinase n=1 Tax=Microbacterium sp. HD4P20 TaxID=2864874 RepID=UPI0020A4AE61|nr:HAMP domain-containing sensor histidine kinase [Microbacterium sp. HD4P20]MCP2637195.1 HAMP domain-containing histidine kinase [Microbacterium sp. HD4P20]